MKGLAVGWGILSDSEVSILVLLDVDERLTGDNGGGRGQNEFQSLFSWMSMKGMDVGAETKVRELGFNPCSPGCR